MLILLLKLALRLLAKLIIPPPAAESFPVADVNAACPCCGHREGEIACWKDGEKHHQKHICHVCGAQWSTPMVCDTQKVLAVNETGQPPKSSAPRPATTFLGLNQ